MSREYVFFKVVRLILHRTHSVFRVGIDVDVTRVMRRFERHPQNLYRMIDRWRCKSLALQRAAERPDVRSCDLAQEAISLRANMERGTQ